MRNNKLIFSFGTFLLLFIIFSSICSAGLMSSNSRSFYNSAGNFNPETYFAETDKERFQNFYSDQFDLDSCRLGQDFIVQIDHLGCTPAVVRSDLLEEQNVPVFCPLKAIKINPLIDVQAIKSIDISSEVPQGVLKVQFYPSKAAIYARENSDLNALQYNNIGYAVITLVREENESKMPDYFEGNISARITYDVKNFFGIEDSRFYIPVLDDDEWANQKVQYSFFDGKGYLKVDDITSAGAQISVYSDVYRVPIQGDMTEKRKLANFRLKPGEESSLFYMPGFDCFAGARVILKDIQPADKKYAILKINGEYYSVIENEPFLENKCFLTEIEKYGVAESVKISCEEDSELIGTFGNLASFSGSNSRPRNYLSIYPSISISIDGVEGDYPVGSYLTDSKDGNYEIYLSYSEVLKDELYVRLYLLSKSQASQYTELIDGKKFLNSKGLSNSKQNFVRDWVKLGMNLFDKDEKTDYFTLKLSEPKQVKDINFVLNGYGGPENYQLKEGSDLEKYYNLAMDNYSYILENYNQEKYPDSDSKTVAERALYAQIELSEKLNQRKTAFELCEDFSMNYPDSKAPSICDDLRKLSGRFGTSSQRDFYIDGEYQTISLEGVYEASIEDYGVQIRVEKDGKLVKEEFLGISDLFKRLNIDESGEEYIELISIKDKENVEFKYGLEDKNSRSLKSNSANFRLNNVESIGQYTILVKEINLKEVALIEIKSEEKNYGTEADFKFRIEVEKRAIKLSPEKINEKIENLNKTLEKWEDISESLASVVKTMKSTCLATGAVLTVKNLISNSGGKSIARTEVMTGEGGWNSKCESEVNLGKYSSIEECLFENSDQIDEDVNQYYSKLSAEQTILKDLEEGAEYTNENNPFGGKTIDNQKYKESLFEEVKFDGTEVEGVQGFAVNALYSNENINLNELKNDIQSDKCPEYSCVSIEELRAIYLYDSLINDPSTDSEMSEVYQSRLYQTVYNIRNRIDETSISGEESSETIYKNPYKNPKVKYYDTGAFKGYPAIVPVDIDEGWYVALKQTLGTGNNIRTYDASARLNSGYLCNVGKNGIQEFTSEASSHRRWSKKAQ